MSCSDYCIVLFKYIIATLEKHRRALRHLNHYVPQKDWMVMKEQSLDVATARPSWLWLYNYDIALQSIMKYNRTWFTLLSLSLYLIYTVYNIDEYTWLLSKLEHVYIHVHKPSICKVGLPACLDVCPWILRRDRCLDPPPGSTSRPFLHCWALST